MAIGKEFTELEKRIGYNFKDVKFLETALTQTSYSNEQKSRGMNFSSNERLEFLGDSVLELVVSEYLYAGYKNRSEGQLTKMRQRLVCEKTLSKIAAEIRLGEYLNVGRGEELTDLRKRPKVLADALEALLAAVYLDSGRDYESYSGVIIKLFKAELLQAANMHRGDFKTLLQELVEKDGAALLEYVVLEESGPEHDKVFKVGAVVNNNLVGTGISKSKKDAEMKAAEQALRLFGVNV